MNVNNYNYSYQLSMVDNGKLGVMCDSSAVLRAQDYKVPDKPDLDMIELSEGDPDRVNEQIVEALLAHIELIRGDLHRFAEADYKCHTVELGQQQ